MIYELRSPSFFSLHKSCFCVPLPLLLVITRFEDSLSSNQIDKQIAYSLAALDCGHRDVCDPRQESERERHGKHVTS